MDLVSPQPFWLLKNGLIRGYPSLRKDLRCDVAVLGAGISGTLVAQRLSRAGFQVVVIDKRDVACGSTSASTALLQYEIDVHLVELERRIGRRRARQAYRACYASIDTIEKLTDDVDARCTFQRRPSAYLATKPSDARLLREEGAARRAAGIDVEYLDSEAVSAWFSFSRPAALISQQAAQLDAHRLSHALLVAAVADGAQVFDRTTVTSLRPERSGVRLKTENGCTVHARHVVLATGYESQEYLPRKIVQLKCTFAIASEPVSAFPGWWRQCLLWETARPYLYLRTTADRRILVGGEDEPFRDADRRDHLVNQKADTLVRRFQALFPEIRLKVDYRWAGTFGETKDGLAYIGQIRQMPHCFFTLGFGGNGITYSVIAADIIERALSGRRHPDAHLFEFDR